MVSNRSNRAVASPTLNFVPLWTLPFISLVIAAICAKDFLLPEPPFLLNALTDEPAHIATALLSVGALYASLGRLLAKRSTISAALGGTLIDLDHIPLALGRDWLTIGTNRPYTHSLLTLVVLLFMAFMLRGKRREGVFIAALGLMSHLIRDMSYGPLPLFWPFPPYNVTLPYLVYFATLILCGGAIVFRSWATPPSNRARKMA